MVSVDGDGDGVWGGGGGWWGRGGERGGGGGCIGVGGGGARREGVFLRQPGEERVLVSGFLLIPA